MAVCVLFPELYETDAKLVALDWLDELLIPDVALHRFHRLTTYAPADQVLTSSALVRRASQPVRSVSGFAAVTLNPLNPLRRSSSVLRAALARGREEGGGRKGGGEGAGREGGRKGGGRAGGRAGVPIHSIVRLT